MRSHEGPKNSNYSAQVYRRMFLPKLIQLRLTSATYAHTSVCNRTSRSASLHELATATSHFAKFWTPEHFILSLVSPNRSRTCNQRRWKSAYDHLDSLFPKDSGKERLREDLYRVAYNSVSILKTCISDVCSLYQKNFFPASLLRISPLCCAYSYLSFRYLWVCGRW